MKLHIISSLSISRMPSWQTYAIFQRSFFRWTVVGYLKRSLQRVAEHPND